MEAIFSTVQGRVSVTILRVSGEITMDSYQELQRQAEEAIQAGTRNLLLDLTDVTYVSSSGLRAIHHIFTRLREQEAGDDEGLSGRLRSGTYRSPSLKLLNPSRDVLRTLKLAGYDMFLDIHSDLQKAIDSF